MRNNLAAILTAVLLAALPAPALSQQDAAPQDDPLVPEIPTEPGAAADLPALPEGVAPLTRPDLDAWLDGYMPYALAQGDVAGAVVVIVKDGEILTRRGFGYADVETRKPVDPETTLFRPGSVSKLLTWTAVLQQVEQGRIDLDANINEYLDFEIPPRDGEPVTMRDVMTHTAGFEEAVSGIIVWDRPIPNLEETLKRWTPERIFAPGTTPAYSNYATSLAGYVVERVSGRSFDDYIEQHVFEPLGMQHSSFRQPLPEHLQPLMSSGYERASGEAQPYELIAMAPAGSLAASGVDMAKFMLAHLDDGGPLLSARTAALMHRPDYVSVPGLNRMALGFYEQQVNGQSAIGHGGDTVFFHSYLWLFPRENVGMFVSLNSSGREGATLAIRIALFEQFADRYFPAPDDETRVELETAAEHARLLTGTWENSRRAETSFLRALQLVSQVKIGLGAEGRPLVEVLPRPGGGMREWIEVEPFIWEGAGGMGRLGAQVENGQVVRWSINEVSPFMVFERAPWYRDSGWLLPAFLFGLFVIGVTTLSWPVAAIARRRFGAALPLAGSQRKAYRLTRGFALLTTLVVAGWAALFSVLMSDYNTHEQMGWLIWLLQMSSVVAFFGLIAVAVWNLVLVWTHKRGWVAKLWSVLLVLGALFSLWVALVFKLISFGANF